MKATFKKPLHTLIVTLGFLTSCGVNVSLDETLPTPSPVDEYRIEQLSRTACPSSQKLRINTNVRNLNLNNLVTTGQVKAVIFKKGVETCALKFTFNFANNENKLTGEINVTADGTATPPQLGGIFGYQVTLPNSQANTCVNNGSAWEVITTSESGSRMQITFKNISDSGTIQYLNLASDKLITVRPLADAVGMTAYTCQN